MSELFTNPLHFGIAGLLAVLVLASVVVAVIAKLHPKRNYVELKLRMQSWWWIFGVFFLAIIFNRTVAVVVLTIVSFMAFKEYLSLIQTRRADHRVLLWAYLAIPLQYLWVGLNWYGMFIIFIPVYVFLFLPVRMVMIGEHQGFLRAASTIQWGLMTTVFSLSHMVYLLALPPRTGLQHIVTGEMLLFFLVVLTQLNDVGQYLWGKALGQHKVIPKVSPNKTIEGLIGGVGTTVLLSYLLSYWFTAFETIDAILVGLLIGFAGFFGDVVMSAVKRDIGVKDSGTLIPGHGGILDRLDSLTFTAPLFFHYVYYFYY